MLLALGGLLLPSIPGQAATTKAARNAAQNQPAQRNTRNAVAGQNNAGNIQQGLMPVIDQVMNLVAQAEQGGVANPALDNALLSLINAFLGQAGGLGGGQIGQGGQNGQANPNGFAAGVRRAGYRANNRGFGAGIGAAGR